MRRAKILSFVNYKGGVGKTTTTYHVGCSLAQHHGKKVLMVDIDPQTNLTFLCVTIPDWENFKQQSGTISTLYQQFLKKQAFETKRVILRSPVGQYIKNPIQDLDLIPCDVALLGEDLGGAGGITRSFPTMETLREHATAYLRERRFLADALRLVVELLGEDLAGAGGITESFPTMGALRRHATAYLRERRFLADALRLVENDYDYILIDCPPNLYLMTQCALVASDYYVMTAVPDHFSTIGVYILKNKVEEIGKRVRAAQTFANEKTNGRAVADFGGVVFVKVRVVGAAVTNIHATSMRRVEDGLGTGSCFGTYTTELSGYGEASEDFLPVWMASRPNTIRASRNHEYEKITNELLSRV